VGRGWTLPERNGALCRRGEEGKGEATNQHKRLWGGNVTPTKSPQRGGIRGKKWGIRWEFERRKEKNTLLTITKRKK